MTRRLTQTGADRLLLKELYEAAVARAQPSNCLKDFLPEPPAGRTIVLGGGKAGGAMSQAFEAAWPGRIDESLVITRYGYAQPTENIRLVEAAHPVPDQAGVAATAEMLRIANGAGKDDLVICLLSGGGSALLTAPAPGISLADKQTVTEALLRSGAPIQDINTVRRHLSAIKGGGLARAAFPARLVTLAISDVVGDDPLTIASGPTVPDPTTAADALATLTKWNFDASDNIIKYLQDNTHVKDQNFEANYRLIASPGQALSAAAELAEKKGLKIIHLGDALEGEARDVGARHANLARRLQRKPEDHLILSGGELTVTIRGEGGQGGPNREYALGLALALGGAGGIVALAADTDGVDGSGEIAGALVDPKTWTRAREAGVDLGAMLSANNSHQVFEQLGDSVATGPTFTNVNDFRAIIVRSRKEKFHAP